ncbi:MAG: hypothetical protein ACE5H8_03015 [Alphaproteobacteria bacterium]
MRCPSRICVVAGAAFMLLACGGVPAWTQTTGASGEAAKELGINHLVGDPNKPRHHFRVRNPKFLSPEDAEVIYRQLIDEMGAAYRLSGRKVYDGWRRYNRVPYISAAHGQRYVNNYANARGHDYGKYERAGRLPVGALIAKDSFSVTEDGEIHPGPLFLMTKMDEGFNYVSGDWRYTMIMPDGSIFGETKGMNEEGVEYCVGCHLAVEKHDHLYFPPEEMRLNF